MPDPSRPEDPSPRTPGLVLVGLAGLALLASILWWFVDGGAAQGPTPGAEPDPVVRTEPLPRLRVPIPRPARREAPPEAEPSAVSEPDEPDPARARPDEPDDSGGDADSGSEIPAVHGAPPDLATRLQDGIGEVQDELIECLQGWHEAQPDVFVGRAVFSFHLDDQGVAEMEVLDVETVPEQTLTCIGDVLWEDVDWPRVDEPLEVTWPVQVSVNDDDDDDDGDDGDDDE